ncbi:MAG: hypothetical protein A2Y25_00030 [Candidatus Melainabacteria bacterium GWF2_37_15]|nr:MAG: hypothetical protein A2Y25_00030 [Candidatus Melainabacteria bacterium GWF2_37_15]
MSAFKDITMYVGRSGLNLLETLKYIFRGKINIGDTALQIVKTGIGSLFIVVITQGFIGLAMSTQLAREFEKLGAEHFIGGFIALATVRELAPVISAIVVSGRVGAAISAEIGSMKVSEQIDALSVFGINPIRYLLVPRLLAASMVTPLLTIVAAFVSILAGMLLSKISVDVSYSVYLSSVRQFVMVRDVFIMMFKAVIFGGAIAIIATTTGLEVKDGAEAVGNATTKTVVWSIMTIFALNYIITSMFF